jgi:ABC-2 type transport system ATP-binding protein
VSANTSVDVVDVSKQFRLFNAKYQSLKERVLHGGKNPYQEFWALKDVAFEVAEGQTVGILGRNGSGKSTLLKCISGILKPTKGKVLVRGQLAALLELGAGFQPELSGRDNIYLNGSLLGLSQKEMDRRFDQIVAFAELENFIDNQVKFYSSGMFVRLGFAVAVNVDPDVLVVDEVLAVGDENFQHKCLARIREFQEEGRTILFVTHSSELVRQVCDRAVVLSDGVMIGEGTAAQAVRTYQKHLADFEAAQKAPAPEISPKPPDTSRPLHIGAIEAEPPGQGSRPYFITGEPLRIQVRVEATEHVNDVVIYVDVRDRDGLLVYSSDTGTVDQPFSVPFGGGRIHLVFEEVPLLDGDYVVHVGIHSRDGFVYDIGPEVRFEVMNPGRSRGKVDMHLRAEIDMPGLRPAERF